MERVRFRAWVLQSLWSTTAYGRREIYGPLSRGAYRTLTGSRRNPLLIPRQMLKWPPVQGRVGLFQPIDRYVSAVDPVGTR